MGRKKIARKSRTKRRAPARRRTYARKAAPVRKRRQVRAVRRSRKAPVRRARKRSNPSIIGNPTVQAVGYAGGGFLLGQYVDGAAHAAHIKKMAAGGGDAGLTFIEQAADTLTMRSEDGSVTVPAQLVLGAAAAAVGLGAGKMGNAKTRRALLAVGLGMFIQPAANYVGSLMTETSADPARLGKPRVYKLSTPKGASHVVAASRAAAGEFAN